jgi:hypothetical protein
VPFEKQLSHPKPLLQRNSKLVSQQQPRFAIPDQYSWTAVQSQEDSGVLLTARTDGELPSPVKKDSEALQGVPKDSEVLATV